MKAKTIIFDLDGTLIDTMGIFAEIASRLIAGRYNISEEEACALYLKTSGIPFAKQLDILFPGDTLNKESALLYEETKTKKLRTVEVSMLPDEAEALREFASRGYRLGISSSEIQEIVDRFVLRSGLPFLYKLGYRDGFAKGKEHFSYILAKGGGAPEDIIFIGDSPGDMEKAHESGVGFIGKLGTFKKEDFKDTRTIESLRELLHIL